MIYAMALISIVGMLISALAFIISAHTLRRVDQMEASFETMRQRLDALDKDLRG